jgi:hypothetical protein
MFYSWMIGAIGYTFLTILWDLYRHRRVKWKIDLVVLVISAIIGLIATSIIQASGGPDAF